MNNICITITRQNKSFKHNINPLTWLKQLKYHDTIYTRALVAGVRIYLTALPRTQKNC